MGTAIAKQDRIGARVPHEVYETLCRAAELTGADVVSGAHFDAWWKKARGETPDLLTFTPSLLAMQVLIVSGDPWRRRALAALRADWDPAPAGPRHGRGNDLGLAPVLDHLGVDMGVLDHHRVVEHRHVRQYEWLGPLFLPAYFGLGLYAALRGRHPYRDNLLERHAGLGQDIGRNAVAGAQAAGPIID